MTIAKRLLGLIFSAGLPFVALPALGTSDALAQSSAAEVRAEGDVAGISYFYDALNDDGGWVEHPRYGLIWQPDVDDDWRPYTLGRWAFSDAYGWTWLSDEPFGWAVYHYGRWSRDPEFGWIWVPGSEWAPAWVLWRYNDEAVGWAPMPPETRFERGRVFADPGSYESRRFLSRWVFASPRSFTRANVSRYVRPASWNRELMSRTRSRLSYDMVDNRVVNRGVPVDELEKMLRGPVPRAKILPVDAQGARERQASKLREKAEGDLGDVELYRPERERTEGIVRNNPSPRVAGKPKHRSEFGRLAPQRRERFERDERQLSDETRRPRKSDEALGEDRDERPARAAVREDDQGPRDRSEDGAYRPWRDPDGRNPDSRRDDAERRLERGNDVRKAARRDGDPQTDAPADEPPRKGDASLPVDDAPPAGKSPKKRDAGLQPKTMPEPELIDPAPGKKAGKPVEYYEEVPADDGAAPPAAGTSLPSEGASDRPRGRTNDRPGRFGNADRVSKPEPASNGSVAAPDDDPVSALDPPVKSKTPPGMTPETSKPKPASKKALDKEPETAPAKSSSPEKPKAAKADVKELPTAKTETGTVAPRKRPPEQAAAPSAETGDDASKPKAKRRWDQDDASGSGYPTVVGPDGKEAPN